MASNPNLTRKTLIMAMTESNPGSDQITDQFTSNTVSSAAFLAFDEINPLSIDFNVVDTAPVRASLTPQKQLIGRKLVNIRPKTMWMNSPGVDMVNLTDSPHTKYGASDDAVRTADFAVSGQPEYALVTNTGTSTPSDTTIGHAPFFGSLLRACGLKQANGLSASVIYTPRSSAFETATVHTYADSILHKATGCVGTFTLAGTAGEGIETQFDLQGNYAAPTAPGLPTVKYPADLKKLLAFAHGSITADADTSTANDNGVGYEGGTGAVRPIIRSFNFDAGVTVTERGDINSNEGLYGLYITDRSPTLELVVEVENKLVSSGATPGFNPILDMANAHTHNIVFEHGNTTDTQGSSGRTKFTFPDAQLVDVQYGDDSGIRTYNLSYNLTSTTDDGEYKIEMGHPDDAGNQT